MTNSSFVPAQRRCRARVSAPRVSQIQKQNEEAGGARATFLWAKRLPFKVESKVLAVFTLST
ncbi:MAG: hypothetical protein E2O37_07370 [Proteobacteria bacterium]|nr:MAG: hypothetical protein E2O37_07370 [Pseudomonadota bacterium]